MSEMIESAIPNLEEMSIIMFSMDKTNRECRIFPFYWVGDYPTKSENIARYVAKCVTNLAADQKPEMVYMDNSVEHIHNCEDLRWNHDASVPYQLSI